VYRQVVAVYVRNRYRNDVEDHMQLGPQTYLESQFFAMYHFWNTETQTVRYSCIALSEAVYNRIRICNDKHLSC
jgi:hypothetical protein